MEEYIWRRQNTVAQFIATQSLLDLCGETERTPGSRVGMQWRKQEEVDLTGARDTDAAEAKADADADGIEK